jgi:hypothetical protein
MPLQQAMQFITIHGGDMILTSPMKVYYIAYQYQSGLELLDGPFGTVWEAYQLRDAMVVDSGEDDNLKVVAEFKEVVVL